MTTTNMEEVPLSPKLKGSLKSPSLRVRSPSAKSNIAISRGDDDSSIDDDRPKMCVSDGSTITCVFNKKRLFGGSAFAFVAVVVIMAVAIATRSDGGSSSSANHMAKVASVGGGNSNAAVGTAEVGSAAPPKVAPVAPKKVAPVAPAKSNFAFVAPNSGVGGGSAVERCPGVSGSGKSGKSGSFCYSSGKSGKSGGHGLINLGGYGSSWYGSGKSGKSGSFQLAQTCAKPSGKSGKSGYNSFLDAYRVGSDSWYSSGKSGKSGAGYCTLSPENYQNKESTCVTEGDLELNPGCWDPAFTGDDAAETNTEQIKLDQPICGSLSRYGGTTSTDPQDIDVYKFDVICPGPHTLIIRSTGVNPTGAGLFQNFAGNILSIIQPTLFGSNAQCQAPTGGSVFTDPININPVADGGILTSVFSDLQNEIFAVTVDVPQSACGAIYIQLTARDLNRSLLPTCNEGDYNCGDLGGFLYSVELTEGTVKCGTVSATGTFVACE